MGYRTATCDGCATDGGVFLTALGHSVQPKRQADPEVSLSLLKEGHDNMMYINSQGL